MRIASGRFAESLRAAGAAFALAAAFAAAPAALALGPHELAVVVNAESTDSVILGTSYARLRGVPDENVVRVSVPAGTNGVMPIAISREDFEALVWNPVREALAARGLEGRVLAWAYSCDFPARVAASAESLDAPGTGDLSLTGATFVRAQWPDSSVVERGGYDSPLFAGPAIEGAPAGKAASFDQSRALLLEGMPVPAMMLAWTGERGQTLDAALDSMERTAEADCTSPHGTVWFALREDVRSSSRAWQYEAAAEAVRAHEGVEAVISSADSEPPDGALVGYMTGARTLDPLPRNLLPGSYADHFTSFACAFDLASQMKAPVWLDAGASATSGTVAEPYAIWAKFPSARLFADLMDGFTMAEALYASIRCPLQILPLGDPLSKPWAPRLVPAIEGVEAGSVLAGPVALRIRPPEGLPEAQMRCTWMLDGAAVGSGSFLLWDTRSVADGRHVLRLVVQDRAAPARPQGFASVAVTVRNGETPRP